MRKSAAKSNVGKTGDLDLEFPVAPDYAPLPPALSFDEAARLIEQLRAWFPHAMETEQERLARKIMVEFEL